MFFLFLVSGVVWVSHLSDGITEKLPRQGLMRCHKYSQVFNSIQMNVYTIVCLCVFDQGVSGLLVTFVCETIKLSHRFRQVHDALLVINHPEKAAMILNIFWYLIFWDVLSIWILDKTRWHMIFVFDHINPRMVPVAVGCVSGQDLFLVRGQNSGLSWLPNHTWMTETNLDRT